MKPTDTKVLELLADFIGETASSVSLSTWNRLKEETDKVIRICNLETDYSDKPEFKVRLEKALRQAQVFLIFPQLVGCHITCYLGLSTAQRQRLMLNDNVAKTLVKSNDTVPTVYCGDLEVCQLGLVNQAGNIKDHDNISELVRLLSEHVDPSGIFSVIAKRLEGLEHNRIIIDIPRGIRIDNPFFRAFLDVANEVVVHKKTQITNQGLDYLQNIRSRAVIAILDAPGADHISYPRLRKGQFNPKINVQVKAQFAFVLEIKRAMQRVGAWSYNEVKSQDIQLANIRNDLIHNSGDAELSSLLKQNRKEANTNIERLKSSQRLLSDSKNALLLHANEIYGILERVYISNHGHADIDIDIEIIQWDNWCIAEDYFLALFHSDLIEESLSLSETMQRSGYPYLDVLNAYTSELKDEPISKKSVMSLVNSEDKPLLHRAAIHFTSHESPDADNIAKEHARKIALETGKEWYFHGLATGRESDFRRSLQEGYAPAGTKLYESAQDKSASQREKTLKFLARHLVPEANYELGSQGRGRYAQTQLRMASAMDHTPALKKLLRIEKNEDVLLMLFNYLDSKQELNSRDLFEFGRFLQGKELFNQSHKILERSDEAEALSLRARMYQYGDGVAQDLSKAKELYKFSDSRKPNDKVKKSLDKVNDMLIRKANRSENRSYSGSSRTSSSYTIESSWCFLTTATCEVKGYPDDCEVLNTFRAYRDNILRNERGGEALIAEYYSIAPEIVRRIANSENPMQTYNLMWDEYLYPCYNMLLEQDYSGAKVLYIELVGMLDRKFQVSLKKSI
ncbi:MAG: SEL1-like repeat protein [Vibrio sp.]